MFILICLMQTCFENKLVWKQVRLLVLHCLVGQGELGMLGRLGAPRFSPQQTLRPTTSKTRTLCTSGLRGVAQCLLL